MLEQMSPADFRERVAHYQIEPWGDDWQQTGMICAANHDSVTRYMKHKNKGHMEEKDCFKWYHFAPVIDWLRDKLDGATKKHLTPEELERSF